jgi:CRISPR-associated protein (TIGR02584 family)
MNGAGEKKHVLFSVAGTTPAVVTETLYGLMRGDKDRAPVTKGEIHILTTLEGKKQLENLVREINKFCDEYKKEYGTDWKIAEEWTPETGYGIEVLRYKDGEEIPDLRDRKTNEVAADRIVEIVRELTSREDVVLHASLAGGRRTMGVFLAQAMSWFARQDDKLYHVLVPLKYETQKDWFYPKPGSEREKNVVELSEQPFVRMRDFFFSNLAASVVGKVSYLNMMKLSEICLNDKNGNPPGITIIIGCEQKILIDGLEFMPIAESELSAVGMYLFLCKYHNLSVEESKKFYLGGHTANDIQNLKDFFQIHMGVVDRFGKGLKLMEDQAYTKRQTGFKTLLEKPTAMPISDKDDRYELIGLEWSTHSSEFYRQAVQRKNDFGGLFSDVIKPTINHSIWPNATLAVLGRNSYGRQDKNGGERYVNIPLDKIKVKFASRSENGGICYSPDIADEVFKARSL